MLEIWDLEFGTLDLEFLISIIHFVHETAKLSCLLPVIHFVHETATLSCLLLITPEKAIVAKCITPL